MSADPFYEDDEPIEDVLAVLRRPPDGLTGPGPTSTVVLSTQDISMIYGVPTGTVHRWASEDGWTRYGTRARRRWDLEQVQASLDRRQRASLTSD